MDTVRFSEEYGDKNRDVVRMIEQRLREAFGMDDLICTYAQERFHRTLLTVAQGDELDPRKRKTVAEILYQQDLAERPAVFSMKEIIEDVTEAAWQRKISSVISSPQQAPGS